MMAQQVTAERPRADNQQSCQQLLRQAEARVRQGLAPPPEIYRLRRREQIDWSAFPSWARPVDPELFDGCCHEG